jgi:hypothetical protein
VEKNDWYLANLTLTSLTKKKFVLKLHSETPSDWKPPVRREHPDEAGSFQMVPDPNCIDCKGSGKVYPDGLAKLCPCNTSQWVSDEELYAQ